MKHPSAVLEEGVDVTQLDCRLLWANEREVEPEHLAPWVQTRTENVCWLIRRGHLATMENDSVRRIAAGNWVLPASQGGSYQFSPRCRIVSIRFEMRQRGGLPVFPQTRTRVLLAHDFPDLEAAACELIELFQRWGRRDTLLINREKIPLAENFAIETAFFGWLSIFASTMGQLGIKPQRPTIKDERATQAAAWIDSLPMREKFSYSTLASVVGLSPNQLSRIFQDGYSMSPFQYYDNRRLALALNALELSTLPLKEIAYALGFSAQSHFSSWFRQHRGHSPRSYRQSTREAQ